MTNKVKFFPNRSGYNEMMAQSYRKTRDLAELTADGARGYSPYDTGNNRDSIQFKESGRGRFMVYTESGYGGWLEIGTTKMPARPYIRPAYYEAKDELERRR